MNNLLIPLLALLLPLSAQAVEPTAPAARTLVLVRHGHYLPDPAADEKLGPHLSSLGVAQAKLVGARLAGLPARFDALHVSPVQRARDTAAVIGAGFPDRQFAVVEELAECTPPTRRTKVTAADKPADLAACEAQFDKLFADHFKPAAGGARTELMVAHGNVIRSMIVRALGVDHAAWLEMSIGHASITRIRIEADGSFRLISAGDVGHLPPNMLTGATGDADHSLAVPPLATTDSKGS